MWLRQKMWLVYLLTLLCPGSLVCEALAGGPGAGQVLVPLVAWTGELHPRRALELCKLSAGGRPGVGELILHRNAQLASSCDQFPGDWERRAWKTLGFHFSIAALLGEGLIVCPGTRDSLYCSSCLQSWWKHGKVKWHWHDDRFFFFNVGLLKPESSSLCLSCGLNFIWSQMNGSDTKY